MIYSMAALSLAPAAAMAVQVHTDVQAAYNVAKGGTVTKNLVTGLKACEYELNVTLNGKAHNATVSILSGSNVIATKDVTTTATDPTDAVATLKFALNAEADLKLKVENKNANEAVQVAEVTLAVDWNNTSYVVETNKVFSNVKATVEGYQFYIDALGTGKDRNGDEVAATVVTEANTAKTIISDAASALGYIMAAADEDTKINLYNTYKVYDVEAQGNLVCDLNALDAKAKVTEKGYQYDVFNTAVTNLEDGINAVDELIKKAKAASKEGFENRSADLRTRIEAYRKAVNDFNDGDAITFTDPADLADLESDFKDLKDDVTSDTQELALKIAIEAYLPNVQQSYEDALAALNAALIDQTVQKPGLVTELNNLKGDFDDYKTAYDQHYNSGDLKTYEDDQLTTLKAVEKKFTDFISETETSAKTIAKAKVEYNNAKTAADGKVTSLNTKYNENVTALQMYMKGVFTGTMLQNALDDLRVYQTKNIPDLQTKINDYYSANNVANAQLMAKATEISDKASDLEGEMTDIVTNAKSDYNTREGVYNSITSKVTAQQTELDGYNNSLYDEAKANLQSEYNRIKGLITALQGVVDALADDIDSYIIEDQAAYTTIVSEVDGFGDKVTPANTEAQNYKDLKAAINAGDNSLVKKLAAAEALLKTKKADDETTYNKYNSTDGKFVASARFEWKRTALSESIVTLATKVDNLYGNGTTTTVTTKKAELLQEISDLATAIANDYKLASENAVSHYNTILADAAADIDLVEVVRADIKDLDVYTAAPYKYKDELDQIKAAAEKAQTDVAATLDKTGKESVDDLMAIVYASKQTRLNEIKTNAPTDQENYLHDNAASLYSTLKVVVDSKLSDLGAALNTYYTTFINSNPQPDLGLKRTAYDGLYNDYVAAKIGYDADYQSNIISAAALATETTAEINVRVNTFTTLQTDIATVKDNLAKLTRDANTQIEKVQAEKAKKVEVDQLIQNNLTAVLANKKATVDTYEDEAKNAIAGVYNGVNTKISNLIQAVSDARDTEKLVEYWQTTTAPKLEATYNTIKDNDIPTYASKASNLNRNKKDYDTLVKYYYEYQEQQNHTYKTLSEILQAQKDLIVEDLTGAGALNHYKDVLQAIVEKQETNISAIADKHTTQLQNMTYDANFKENMLTAMGKLEQEAKDSVAAAGRNYRDYQAQAASKVVLQNLWNSVMQEVDGDQTNKKAERVALMNEYQQAINDLAVVMETYYPRGWSSSTKATELVTNKMTSLTASINTIAANYDSDIYDADMAQSYIDNRKAVDDELLKADQALSAAAQAIARYSSRTNADLLAAIKANPEYVVVTNLIASYNNDKQAVNTQADANCAAAKGSQPQVRYDNTGDIAAAQAIATNLNNAVTAFKNAIDAVIADVWNDKKADEVDRIDVAWNKIKDFAAIKAKVDAETPETLGQTKKDYFAYPYSIINAIDEVTDAIKDPRQVDIQLNQLSEIAPAVADITTQATKTELATVVGAHDATHVQADKAKIRQLQFVSAKGKTWKITDFTDDEDEMYAVIELENAFDTDVAVYATTGREDYNDGVANKDLVDKRADILAAFTNYDNKRDFFFDNPTGKAQTKLAELKNQIDSDDELAGAVETFETDLEAAKKLVAGSMVAGGYDNIFDDLETRNLTDMTIATQAYIDFIYNIFKTAGIADAATVQLQYAGIDADFNTYIAQEGVNVEEAVAMYQTPFLAAKQQIDDNVAILNNTALIYDNYAAFKGAFEKIMEADGIIANLRGILADLAGNAAYATAITELEGALEKALAKTVISNDPPQFLDDDFEALSEALNVQAQALDAVAQTIESCKADKTILSYKEVIAKQITDINDEIDIILAVVPAKKAAYEAHVALVAMNDRVKLALDEEIAGVQTALDNAKTLIEGYGLDNDSYLNNIGYYQYLIDRLTRVVNQMYKDLYLSDIEGQETDITREDDDSWFDYLCDEPGEDPIQVWAVGTWYLNSLIADKLNQATWAKVGDSIDDLNDKLEDSQSELDNKQMTAQMKSFYQSKLDAIEEDIDDLEQTIDDDNIMDYIGADYQLIGYADIAERIQTALDGIVEDVQGNIVKDDDDDTPGVVDVADYRAMVNYVLQNEGYVIPADKSSQEFMVLDVNGDMQVNSADIVAITNIILYGNPAGFGEAGARSDNATALVNLTQESVTAEIVASSGNTKRIAVSLNNFREYSTYQMDITMPQGMTLVNMTLGERAANHELMTNDLNGTTRVVVSTIGGNIFAGNQGDVLYLDVEIDETYRNNGITFDNVIFGTKDAIAREFVVGGNGTTGIGKIEAAGQYVKDSIYNLGGRVVNGIKKGINIITNNDGKTRKVVKK